MDVLKKVQPIIVYLFKDENHIDKMDFSGSKQNVCHKQKEFIVIFKLEMLIFISIMAIIK